MYGKLRKTPGWFRMLIPAVCYTAAGFLLKTVLDRSTFIQTGASRQTIETAVKGIALIVLISYARKYGISFRVTSRRMVVLCLSAGIILGMITAGIAEVSGLLSKAECSFLWICLICVTGPVLEELIYRGLILQQAQDIMDEKAAILISSLLFSAGHGFPQALAAFPAGIVFSYAMIKERTIVAPVIIHVTSNIILFVFSCK